MTQINENEKVDVDETLEEPEPILDESGEDTTDWKGLALKNYGMAKRYKTDLQKMKEAETKAKTEPPKVEQPQDKKEFDLAEETYLLTKGIKENEFNLVLDEMKSSGKDLKTVINSKYFQEKREELASKDALPSGTKRSSGGAKNEVDYWLAKGEFPPADGTEERTALRRKYVKALAAQDENKRKFTDIPIVS